MSYLLLLLISLCVHGEFISIGLVNPTFNFSSLLESIKKDHPNFIPLNDTVNYPHVDLYTTDFLDQNRDAVIRRFV